MSRGHLSSSYFLILAKVRSLGTKRKRTKTVTKKRVALPSSAGDGWGRQKTNPMKAWTKEKKKVGEFGRKRTRPGAIIASQYKRRDARKPPHGRKEEKAGKKPLRSVPKVREGREQEKHA